jgi:hypothetical protein
MSVVVICLAVVAAIVVVAAVVIFGFGHSMKRNPPAR